MSRLQAPIKPFWDKTTHTDNKLVISNRMSKVIEKIRVDNNNISESKAIEGLILGQYDFEKTLQDLKKHYYDI